MAITSAVCTSFKLERQQGTHQIGTHTLKMALIKDSPTGTYGAGSTNYSDITGNSDETTGTGYSAGGVTLTSVALSTDGTTIVLDFADPSWGPGASFSARGCMVYNSSASNKAVFVIDFGETKTVAAGTFTIQIPLATASLGIMRSA